MTFVTMEDYKAHKGDRDAMQPLGSYLYTTGVSITDSVVELQSYQPYGSVSKSIFAPGYVESSLSISALYTQEGEDVSWMRPGHPPLAVFVDFIDSDKQKKSPDDKLTDALDYIQTLVVLNARRTTRRIGANDGSSATYSIDFVAGEVITLPA